MSDQEFPAGLLTYCGRLFSKRWMNTQESIDLPAVAREAYQRLTVIEPMHAARLKECFGRPLEWRFKDHVQQYAERRGLKRQNARQQIDRSHGKFKRIYLDLVHEEEKLAKALLLDAEGRTDEALALLDRP